MMWNRYEGIVHQPVRNTSRADHMRASPLVPDLSVLPVGSVVFLGLVFCLLKKHEPVRTQPASVNH